MLLQYSMMFLQLIFTTYLVKASYIVYSYADLFAHILKMFILSQFLVRFMEFEAWLLIGNALDVRFWDLFSAEINLCCFGIGHFQEVICSAKLARVVQNCGVLSQFISGVVFATKRVVSSASESTRSKIRYLHHSQFFNKI